MRLIKETVELLECLTYEQQLTNCSRAAAICYGITPPQTVEEKEEFIRKRLKANHESVIEHGYFGVRITADRGVLNELVRHRLASYTQESTRYCAYNKDKFGSQLSFVIPSWCKHIYYGEYKDFDTFMNEMEECIDWCNRVRVAELDWVRTCFEIEETYLKMLQGYSPLQPQEARSILPLSLASTIFMTTNFREWRHFFKLRYFGITGKPQPEMQNVARMIWNEVSKKYSVFFKDLEEKYGNR